jgi:[protein-PII] uridylyltransferase
MQAIMSGYAEDEIAIVAVGGYGRRELGPHSDLDFVFLAEDARAEDGVRSLYRDILQMSEQVGWEIDSALRYPSDAPGLDDKSRTALLDARLVTGSTAIFERFMDVYYETFPVAEFLAAKRRERKIERENRPPPAPGVDPDIADIVPGPQPHPWDDADVAS